LAVIGAVYLARTLMKEKQVDPDVVHDLTVWKEWEIRMSARAEGAGESEAVEISEPLLPTEEQVDINDVLYYDMNAKQKDATGPRGSIEMNFGTNGSVGGRWHGHYYRKDKEGSKVGHDISGAVFGGFICPQKIYQSEGVEDTSKLYFIAQGEFTIQRTNYDTGKIKLMRGVFYMSGWLNKDRSISGEITVMTNNQYPDCFTFSAKEPMPQERMGGGLPSLLDVLR